MGDQINRMHRVNHLLTQTLGRDPTYEETAEKLVTTPKKVENMIQIAHHPISLESARESDDDDLILGDSIEDTTGEQPSKTTEKNILSQEFDEIFRLLSPKEVRVLKLRCGMEDGNHYTLEKVGRKLGLTRERIRQIEAQAYRKLRHPIVKRKLRDYLRD